MKPNFALDLSHDGISLLHRAKGGWSVVGEVALDDPDLGAQLKMLRQTAADLESGGFSTKLIIPNSQILYVTLKAPGPDDATREVQIRKGLEGLTPYPVGDLVFDWRLHSDGKRVRVAVVAHETLDEAEAFAAEYRFNPVSFVCRPKGKFKGEPFFGKSKSAAALLGAAARVEPDKTPMPRRKSAAAAASAMAAAKPEPAPEPELEIEPIPAPPLPPEPEPEAFAPVPQPEPEPSPPDATPSSPYEDDALEALLAGVPDPVGVQLSEVTRKLTTKRAAPKRRRDADTSPQPVLAPFPPTPEEEDEEDYAELSPPVTRHIPKAANLLPETDVEVVDEVKTPPAEKSDAVPGAEPQPAFTSRRASPVAPPPMPDRADFQAEPRPAKRPARGETRGDMPPAGPRVGGAPAATPAQATAADTPAPARQKPTDGGFASIARKGVTGLAGAAGQAGRAGKALAGKAGGATGAATAKLTPRPRSKPAKPSAQADQAAAIALTSAQPLSEADAMTVFGARREKNVGGKPRYLGLILTLVLLLLMAIAAVWSMFFLSDGEVSLFGRQPPTDFATSAPPAVGETPLSDVVPAPAPVTDDRIAALPAPIIPPTPPLPDVAVTPPAPVAPVTPPAGVAGDILSQEVAEARYAATGIWQKAPEPPADPQGDRIDELYVASLDPKITSHDAIALPSGPASARELRPAAPLPPLPPGTEITLDDRGLVTPTAEGTLTQDGILVRLGRPAVVPPARPVTELPPDPVLAAIPRVRPEPRPGDAPAVAPEPEVDPVVDPGTDTPGEAAQIDLSTATDQAVDTSPKPGQRPSDFAAIVAKAREAADAADAAAVTAAAAAPATVAPAIPTRASVATQATVPNAINLRRINLIGIYGSDSTRRALVRMPNGRYVKVAVGDRLDGGKVTAISETQLIYQKSGRNHTLEVLPLG